MFPVFLFQHYFQTFWKEIIFRVSTRSDQICVNENTAEKTNWRIFLARSCFRVPKIEFKTITHTAYERTRPRFGSTKLIKNKKVNWLKIYNCNYHFLVSFFFISENDNVDQNQTRWSVNSNLKMMDYSHHQNKKSNFDKDWFLDTPLDEKITIQEN